MQMNPFGKPFQKKEMFPSYKNSFAVKKNCFLPLFILVLKFNFRDYRTIKCL